MGRDWDWTSLFRPPTIAPTLTECWRHKARQKVKKRPRRPTARSRAPTGAWFWAILQAVSRSRIEAYQKSDSHHVTLYHFRMLVEINQARWGEGIMMNWPTIRKCLCQNNQRNVLKLCWVVWGDDGPGGPRRDSIPDHPDKVQTFACR